MADTEFRLGEAKYRIYRPDSLNLSIQRFGGKSWRTLSYHGSSLASLAHGLEGLITDNCIPDPDLELSAQLTKIIADSQDHAKKILASLRG
jgi:hypothetical protein